MIAGRYSLDRELGRGGMGAVWLGRDEVLGREVAVKRLGLAPGADSPDHARAEREARLAARLSHPHVVAVYDLVEEERQQYLVMEYVEGTNLSGLLRARGPLLPDAAAALLGQAADALASAHEAGIIHRDVKPSNMLVTEDGQLKLSDFGIARAEADPSLTQTGLVTGSPAYLAPEVASGGSAQDTADVWSLGASLFHALTGHPPYEVTDNVLGALYRIVHEEPPRVPEPGWLGPVLVATMNRDPDARWPMARVRDFLLHGPDGAGITLVTDPAAAASDPGTGSHTQELAAVPPVNTGPQPVVPAPTPRSAETRPRRGAGPVLLGLGLGVLVVLAAFLVGQVRDPGAEESASSGDGPSASAEPSAGPTPPTREELEEFAASYVTTAAEDPEAGFALLTPAFQEESSGLEGYTGFWGSVREVSSFTPVGADPRAGTVTYEYSYVLRNGTRRTETIELTLEQQEDGALLIAGGRQF